MPLLRLLLVVLLASVSVARAQDAGVEAPPSAAPVSPVGVAALPVLRSASQQIDDFTSGLVQGLQASEDIPGLALVVVDGDRVMVQKSAGVADEQTLTPINPDSVFSVAGLRNVMIGLAAMQLIEQARLLAADDVATLLDDGRWRGVTVAELLTQEVAGAPEALALIVERRSGQGIDAYVQARILLPLGMANSHFERGVYTTTPSDMGRLLRALLNGGAFESQRILLPDTVDLMTRTHRTLHQALPGWAYVFPEMRRGGWRALQYDGRQGNVAARMVLVPEAKLGYFIVINRDAGPRFWRVMDNALFDRLLPPRDVGDADLRGVPPPSADLSHEVAGVYLPDPGVETEAVFLKTPRGRLLASGRGDGALLLSGAEEAVLLPRPGLYWRSNEAQLAAAYRDGKLLLGHTVYDRFQFWERPGLYAGLALLCGLLALMPLLAPQLVRAIAPVGPGTLRYAGPALLTLAFLLTLTAVVLQRLALGP